MIRKLLQKNISVWQIAGYALATFAGLTIVMLALQFRTDTVSALADDNGDGGIGLISKRNIVISKQVKLSSTLRGQAPAFSDGDIADIARQPWAGRIFEFTSSDFSVWAGIDIGGRTMQTALFFESVPDDVLDIDSADWAFDPADPVIPIIISKDYLALYNFGFATAGRMPPVSEKMLSSLPITVTLGGRGQQQSLPGRIVGYSDWLNTIAVPQRFMDWANARFGSGAPLQPARLVVEVADPADPDVESWLTGRGYEMAGPNSDLGRASFFLNLITGSVAAVGGVITLLAFFILILSLVLLIQKSRPTISGLLLLGYPWRRVSAVYSRLVLAVNAVVLAVAIASVILVRSLWLVGLERIGLEPGSMLMPLLGGALIMAVITCIDVVLIARLVRRCFR